MAATYADETFERLYTRYGREVYRYALALLRNPAEAEDVTQTTFLNAYRALRAGERPHRPHNWLIAIAHNACRSRVRFVMRRPKEVPLDDVMEQLAVPEAERPNIGELLRTIGRLPLNQRAAITMRELEGRSYVDIAETLGVTVPAAEALIGRARRTLRDQAARFRGLALLPSAVGKVAALLAVGVVGAGVGVATGGGTDARSAPAAPATHALPIRRPVAVSTHAARPPLPRAIRAVPTRRSTVATFAGAGTPPRIAADETAASSPTPAPPATTAATSTVAATVATTAATVTQAVTTAVSQLPTVTTPAKTTPPVTTPPVTTPPLTSPPLTTPVATAPPVTVPPVTVPSVTAPSLTVPTVTLP